METQRTHDKLYLDENRKNNPKECFKFVESFASQHLQSIESPKILDIGCATGDQLWFLSSKYPKGDFTGMDVVPELLERAQQEVPRAKFVQHSVQTAPTPELTEKFDAVFMSGVNSIFDDLESWLGNVLKMANSTGHVYIFGLFNPEDIDVLIKSRESGSTGSWETGWNTFSKKSYSLFLEKAGRRHTFHDFDLSIDLPKNPSDPLRSWTEKMSSGKNMVVSGLQLVHQFSLLHIEPRDS